MQRIYVADNLIDAQLVKDALAAADIPAFILGGALTGAMGELPMAGLVEVHVPDSAVAAATPVVAELDAWLSERPMIDDWDGAAPQPA